MIEQKYLEAGSYAPVRRRGTVRAFLSHHYAALLFVCIFVIPTVLATIFYGLIAADRYVSEAQFIVRGVNGTQISGISVLLRTFGIARSNDDAFAIHSYILSRDAINELQKDIDLREVYGRPEADYVTRFGTWLTGNSAEQFYKYYRRQVVIVEDVETGITKLQVSAYRAEDAEKIAARLLAFSEKRVNTMNTRARADTLTQAERTLAEASDDMVKSQLELTRFRNAETLINPQDSASGNFEVIAGLTQELVQQQVRLRQMETSSPSNPNIPAARGRVASLQQQIDAEKAKLTGSDDAIASKLGRYEELLMRRTLADKAYETASNSIDQARQEAARKQIYLESVVQASLPDEAMEPRRLHMVFTVALLSFAGFIMAYMLVSGSREHLNIH